MAGIIGIPGRLQLEWVAAFARNPRPTSSECANDEKTGRHASERLVAFAGMRKLTALVEQSLDIFLAQEVLAALMRVCSVSYSMIRGYTAQAVDTLYGHRYLGWSPQQPPRCYNDDYHVCLCT